MIVLRSPKGWTGPKEVDGVPIEGTWRSHQVPLAAVFDTALHQTMPPKAYLYGLRMDLYERHGIRKYGFHGTSHIYVAQEAARRLGRPLEELRLITCHLGNGCSVTAFREGRSVDTSMGFTPLEGLVMGTRCGDLDPAVPVYLIKDLGMGPEAVDDLLNNESGLKGLCGMRDMRDIVEQARSGGSMIFGRQGSMPKSKTRS